MLEQKMLLDQLMGKNRDLSIREKKQRQEHFSDENVCKDFLVSKCFKDLFPKTPYDNGPCKKRHEPFFKTQFENEKSYKKYKLERRYTLDALAYMESMVAEADGKVKAKRDELDNKETKTVERPKEVQDKIDLLEDEVRQLLDESAKLGEQGQLEESEQKAFEAEQKRKIKTDMEAQADAVNSQYQFAQEVCEVCGAIQSANEDKRRQTHQEGKIHLGFKFFREEIERLNKRLEEIKPLEEEYKKKEKEESRHRSRSRSSHKKHKKRHSSSRHGRDRDRHEKKHKKSSKHRRSRSGSDDSRRHHKSSKSRKHRRTHSKSYSR